MSFFAELRRRNVLRVAAAYIVTAWLVIQVVETIFPAFGFGDVAVRYVTIAFAVGLLPALVVAWVFELTPEGLKKDAEVDHDRAFVADSAKRLDRIILLVLALALGYFAFDKFVLEPWRDAKEEQERLAAIELAREEGRSEAIIESYGDASIAVLAFDNMSPDPDQKYFADGISEDILNLLAGIPELRVISRSSAFTYKGKGVPIPQIAEELNVAHILEGSVRMAGNRVRVTAQLIEGRTDTHLWSQTWDRTLDDIFAIQDEIAVDVVDELRITLTSNVPRSPRTNPEVYALTLQAKQLSELSQNDFSLLPEVSDLLEQVLSIDPGHVPGLELKVLNDFRLRLDGQISQEEGNRRWQAVRQRILSMDPDNRVMASYDAWYLYLEERDLEAAASVYASLLPRSLNDAETLRQIGIFLHRIGKFDEAIAVVQRCTLVDPLKHGCTWQLKESYLWSGDLEQSRIYADRLNRFWGRAAGSNDVYRMLLEGRPEEAKALAMTLRGDPVYKVVLLALAAHDLGDEDGFEAQLAAFHALDPDEFSAYWRLSAAAGLYAYLGDLDRAFGYLEKWAGVVETDAYHYAMSPWYLPLHGDPRWAAFRERLGLGEARLAAINFPLPPQLERGRD